MARKVKSDGTERTRVIWVLKSEYGTKGVVGQSGAYWHVREHWTTSLTKPDEVFQCPYEVREHRTAGLTKPDEVFQ